jgi:PAS domain S-box-containing protein
MPKEAEQKLAELEKKYSKLEKKYNILLESFKDISSMKKKSSIYDECEDLTCATLLKQLQKEEEQKELILETITEAIIYYGKDLKVVYANNKAIDAIGIEYSEFLNKRCDEFCIMDRSRCQNCNLTRAIKDKTIQTDEVFITQSYWLSMFSYPILDENGELEGIVQMGVDITEKVKLQKQFADISIKERTKIGYELHDSLSQLLTGVSFMAGAQKRQLISINNPLADNAESMEEHLKEAICKLRMLIKGLTPVDDIKNGLAFAIQSLIDRVRSAYDIDFDFERDLNIAIKDMSVRNNLYLIIHEAIYNAAKYSCCELIEVKMSLNGNNLDIFIKDNGCGFNLAKKNTSGLGMQIMKNRAMFIGGECVIYSTVGEGTIVQVTVPYNKE